MTQGLGLRDAYSATLARIKEQGGGQDKTRYGGANVAITFGASLKY